MTEKKQTTDKEQELLEQTESKRNCRRRIWTIVH